MFGGLPLEGSGGHGFGRTVDFRRSVSVPALAKERKFATQALMRATERGDVQAFRRLTLEAGAEMSGCRALNRLGNDPVALLNSSYHLTAEEQRRFHRQFGQLPELVVAAEAARAAGAARPSSRYGSKKSVASEASFSTSPPQSAAFGAQRVAPSSAQTSQPPPSATAGSARQQARFSRAQNALTGLAATVRPQMSDQVCQAALADPRLLQPPQELATQALAAIGKALRSEELALKAVKRNPALLRVEALKFKKVLPVLSGILGGPEEAAYAVAVQPEVLEVERPQQLREALRALVDCLCSMKDALWLAVQTMMPPSIEVTASAWTHEEVVGEYIRVEGKEVEDRPLYIKPAAAMKHLGPKAKDVYLRYFSQASNGAGGWLISPMPHGKTRYDPRSPSKSLSAASTKMKEEDRNAFSMATSSRTSPDQVPEGAWLFKHKETKAWTPDTNVVVRDAGRLRSPGVLAVEPHRLRLTFDAAREALGVCWRGADAGGHPPEDVHLASCAVAGDATHTKGDGRFKSVGAFSQDTNGYLFLKSTARQKATGEPVLRLRVWESICVTVLYCDRTEEDKAPPVVEEQAPEPPAKGKKDKDGKGKDKGKGKKDEEAEPAAPPEPPKEPHVLKLEAAGFRPPRVMPALPELQGVPQVKDVLCQCFPQGEFEIPLPRGPGKLKLAPLVFVRAQVCALAGNGAACEVAKAKAGEPVLFAESEERRRSRAGDRAEAAAAAVGEGAAAPAHAQGFVLQSTGELGYNGYNFLRMPMGQGSCEPSEALLKVDSGDRIEVAFAQFRLPPKPATPAEAEDAEAQEKRRTSLPPPVAPDWVKAEGWSHYECRIPLTVTTDQGEQVTTELVYEKTFEGGTPFQLRGSGQDVLSIAFFRRVGDPRPDPLRTLLLMKPSLLASGDRIADLLRRLRVELGEVPARQIVMTRTAEWAGLCIGEDEAAVVRWVKGHKLDALAREVRGKERAKSLLERPEIASATAQLLCERCEALREALGGSEAMLDALSRRPQLLASEAHLFNDSQRVLSTTLSRELAQQVLRKRTDFLARAPELAALFAKLRDHFPELAERRLRERTAGEWARWPELVGQAGEALHDWIGRISAEERAERCQNPTRASPATRSPAAAPH